MYYLIEITTYTDETRDAYGIYPYDNLDAATAAFHGKMAGAIRSENYATELCQIIDEEGLVKRGERWVRPVVVTEAEPVAEAERQE